MPTKQSRSNSSGGTKQPQGNSSSGDSKQNRLVALQSTLLRRLGFLDRAGIQYGGKRDIYAEAGYAAVGTENFALYKGLYGRNEVAGRIVDLVAKTSWKMPPEIVETGGADDTKFTRAFSDLAKRIHLWRELERGDQLSGIGRYGVLMIGMRGVTEDLQQASPAPMLQGPQDILYLRAYDEDHARVERLETDPNNERFGLPEIYQIRTADAETSSLGLPRAQMRVHASRVIHMAEDSFDGIYGRPRLQRVLNRLYDVDKISAASAESYWQAATRILQAKIPSEVTTTTEQLDKLEEDIAEMVHALRREFVGKGVELAHLPVDVPELGGIGDYYFSLLSVGCGIPRRILFGSERGELASTTDQATFFGMIAERQQHFTEPDMVRAFIDRLLELGALPKPPGGYEVVWPELFELTALETAEANLKRAQTASALTPMGGDPATLVEIDEERNVWLVPKAAGEPGAFSAPPPSLGLQPPLEGEELDEEESDEP